MRALDRMPEREAAAPLWRRNQEELAQAAPHTVLYYPEAVKALGKRLQGVDSNTWADVLPGSARWWIPPDLRR
jgi:hypothetical protein